MLFTGNYEPPLSELLDDPAVKLLMARDGLTREVVWAEMEKARQILLRRSGSSQSKHPK